MMPIWCYIDSVFLPLMALQSEMKLFGAPDTTALKQHFGKKVTELEDEKRAVQVILFNGWRVNFSWF